MTTSTPRLRAARAVSFISSAARCRTPSGSPSPQTRALTMPRCRSSIGSSQTALTVEVVGDGPDLQAVLVQHLKALLHVGVVVGGLLDIEVVAPAGDLQAV